jgi:DNA (cytosine-5)-methyltransferase 1
MIKHDKWNTWLIINNVFQSLGYNLDYKILNSIDFGIPQNRNRLFGVGVRKDLNIKPNIPINKNYFIHLGEKRYVL